jgi:hypothetical protein
MSILGNGNVGIGTTSPAYPLQVRRAGGGGSLGISIDSVGTTDRAVQYFAIQDNSSGAGSGHAFYYRPPSSTTDTLGLFLSESGNVGIGTTSPGVSLEVNGLIRSIPTYNNTSATLANLVVTAGGTFERSTASSGRYKENITDWNGGLDLILALKPKTFTYKKDYYDKANIHFLGLIAEEVSEVSPYLADYENEDRTGDVENVRYANIVVPLIKAIQEQQAQIEELKALINK